jgi:uncharacterized protein YpiB (UPF0302 family)
MNAHKHMQMPQIIPSIDLAQQCAFYQLTKKLKNLQKPPLMHA